MPVNPSYHLRTALRIIAAFAVFLLAACGPALQTAPPTGRGAAATGTASPLPSATATAPPVATRTLAAATSIPATPTVQLGPLEITSAIPTQIGRYETLELDLHSDIVPSNPFDPDELDIRLVFTSPSGKTWDVGAFWFQGYYRGGSKKGQPGWKARFTPTETGEWSVVARLPARRLESPALHFAVVESARHGFVRVNPSNPRYFAFDDGSFFFPIGLNIPWWTGAGDALTDYGKWMDAFSANGGDTIRVWMAEWSFGIEWNDTPLGDYTNRLHKAWLLDQIFAMAEERDMYVILVLLNCADYNNWQTHGWDGNPYNATRGGPLHSPDQFVTDSTARRLLQRRVNYIVNRWGSSPRLLAWEWWNEVNLAGFSDTTLFPWLQEMTAYLQERDVNHHLVTNSYAISDSSPSWALPEMQIIQKHEYALQEATNVKDLAERAAQDLTTLTRTAPPKPALLGEFGYGNEALGRDVDKSGIHLHNGIWTTTFVGYAGSGMYWFWDTYLEAYNAWHHFQGLNGFLEGVDLSHYQPFSPLVISRTNGARGQAIGLGLRGDDVLIWLRSDAYTVQAATAMWEQIGSPATFSYTPPLVKDQMLTLPGMGDAGYTVQWFDPQAARWLDSVDLTAHGGRLKIPIPDFRRDLAARIIPSR